MTNKQNTVSASDFFDKEFVNYASYATLRMIASAVDGFKNTTRKIAYTALEKNITKPHKVSQFSSKMAEFCLTGDTLVNTVDYGLISFEEILKNGYDNFEVFCLDENGEKTTSIAKYTRFMKNTSELIEIETENDVIRCTPDHKILIKVNNENIWKEAQFLTENDEIVDIM